MIPSLSTVVRSRLSIITYLRSEPLAQWLEQFLRSDRYVLTRIRSPDEFLQFIEKQKQQLDCLILQDDPESLTLANQLYQEGIFFPLVIVKLELEATGQSSIAVPSSRISRSQVRGESTPTPTETATNNPKDSYSEGHPTDLYQAAAVRISITQLSQIAGYIDQAISQFLELSPRVPLSEQSSVTDAIAETTTQDFLLQQQRRLAEKLRERLGYLGVYYKRNPKNFFRNLSSSQKQEFLEQIRSEYRQIVVTYFTKDARLNQKIDDFVTSAFFSDIPVTQIVEIHMDLMDELSKHLKLEGRSDDVLLDYRLTLIDVIAHLCEMYRRSIPRDS